MTTHDFAFDVKLAAVIRIRAASEAEARKTMQEVLQACEPAAPLVEGLNETRRDIRITEFSILPDTEVALFEKDGVETD
jgi:hypothetical protein